MGARLTIHPVGLTEEERKILSVTVNVLIAGGCGVHIAEQLSQDTVAVIDVDSVEGRDFYEHDLEPHIRVVISSDDCRYRADGLIKKPLRVQALRNLLSDISEKISPAEQVDTEQPVQFPATQAIDSASLPNSSLFYALVNAVADQGYLKITSDDNPHPLLVHGPSRHIYTNMTRQEMLQVASRQEDELHVAKLDEFEFMKQAQGFSSHRIEKALWLAADKGALGFVPVNSVGQGEFRLIDWPRFDVKYVKPEYLTLTAIATRRSLTCSALARMTNIPLTTVFDFYHAAQACGVVEHTPSMTMPEAIEAPVVPSLVARIAKKLGIKFF